MAINSRKDLPKSLARYGGRGIVFQFLLIRTLGNFLVLSGLVAIFLTFYPAFEAEVFYRFDQLLGQRYYLLESQTTSPVANLIKQEPLGMEPVNRDFSIVIPKIKAKAPVIANVDPGNYSEYIKKLQLGVAHAKGTMLPGMIGNTFLFAHSVGNFWEVNRYNAVFYLLRELKSGDRIYIFFGGQRFDYEVFEKRVVTADEVGYLYTQTNFPLLTLQTCSPPGTTWKRLLVFARQIN